MIYPPGALELLDFIAAKEAPRGWDTVYGNNMRRMPKPLTQMTIAEVIADGPRRTRLFGSSAAGRYQFMTATLKGLIATENLRGTEKFDANLQRQLGYRLLQRRGFDDFMDGNMDVVQFGRALAMEWASFPVLRDTQGAHRRVKRGQSFYQGDALNKALVSADEVERFLTKLQPANGLGLATIPRTVPAELPQAPTVPADAEPPRAWWQRLLGIKSEPKVVRVARPGLHPKGSPELWDVQSVLKAKGYYTTGLLDGLDGTRTQSAVSQARKDNGLGDGGIDAEFLARYTSFPKRPVSVERATMTVREAAQHAPELFKPPAWLSIFGLGSLGIGGASGSGLIDQVSDSVGRAGDVFGQVQTAFGVVGGIIAFLVAHKTLVFVAIGLFLLWKGVSAILSAWIKVRQAFF